MSQENSAYILLTAEILIGQDMAECILEMFPEARDLLCRNVGDLRGALDSIGAPGGPSGLEIAFIDCKGIAMQDRETLLQEIEARGGSVVLLGASAVQASGADLPRERRNLPMPFDTSMLRAHLA